MEKRSWIRSVAVFSLAFWVSCASRPQYSVTGTATDRQAERQLKADFIDIENFYLNGARETAVQWIDDFLIKHPQSPMGAKVKAYRGDIERQEERYSKAIKWLDDALTDEGREYQPPTFYHWILLRKALSQQSLGKASDYDSTLSKINVDLLSPADRLFYHESFGQRLLEKRKPAQAVEEIVRALSESPKSIPRFQQLLLQSLDQIPDAETILQLQEKNPNSVISDQLLFEAISRLYSQEETTQAKVKSMLFLRLYPQSHLTDLVEHWFRSREEELYQGAPVIGLLIPNDGKWKTFGKRFRQVVEMGLRRTGVRIVVEDDKGNPDETLAAYSRLVNEQHALAVIGPMRIKSSEKIAPKSDELGVPTFFMSRLDTSTNFYSFQMGLSDRQQARALVNYWMTEKKKKRFAIVGPRKAGIESQIDAIWAEIERSGGVIRGFETYDPEENDFQDTLGRLSGMLDFEGRPDEKLLQQLMKDRKHRSVPGKRLPPIVDFDVVFIADDVDKASLIIPTLPYLDIDGVGVAGPSVWNTEENSGRLFSGRIPVTFADVPSLHQEGADLKKFTDEYRQLTGEAPGSLEVIAFDTAAIMAEVLKNAEARKSRGYFRRKLLNIGNFKTLSGTVKFTEEGVQRQMQVFETKKNRTSAQ